MAKEVEKYVKDRPNEILHVTIQRLKPDTREVIETSLDEDYEGLMMLADCVGHKSFNEVVMLDTISNMARKMAQSRQASKALDLAVMAKNLFGVCKKEDSKPVSALEALLAGVLSEDGGDKA